MTLFDVYPLYDIEPVSGLGCHIYDKNGVGYLDFYGGHAVISIGHGHPHYIKIEITYAIFIVNMATQTAHWFYIVQRINVE